MSHSLVEVFVNLGEEEALACVAALLESHQKPSDILAMLQMGLEIVTRRFDRGEYAVAELLMASEIFVSALGLLGLSPVRPRAGRLGSILIGSVYDEHELGKKLLGIVLGASGMRVLDLGVRVEATTFYRAVKLHHPKFVGISCASSLGFHEARAGIEAIRRADPQGEIRILLGGAACDEASAAWAGADIYCRTPREALAYCRAMRSRWAIIPGGPMHSPVL